MKVFLNEFTSKEIGKLIKEGKINSAVRPDLVNLKDACSQVPSYSGEIGDFSTIIWDIKEVSKTGATGDPTKATRKKSEKMLEVVIKYVVNLIQNLEKNNWKYDYKK